MAETTGISWCDATFNPWIGCTKISLGCLRKHCYAEAMVTGRMGRLGAWGPTGARERTSPGNWAKPLRWDRLAGDGLLPDGTANCDGHRPRIFCASLADVFEPRPELDPWRRDLFDLIAATPSLDWLLLTKRPDVADGWLERWYRLPAGADERGTLWNADRLDVEWHHRDGADYGVLPNLWIGASVESAGYAWRADELRRIPASVRFLSCEPLLGSLFTLRPDTPEGRDARAPAPLGLDGIDWIIVGGESGGRASRPMHPDWAREIRDEIQSGRATAAALARCNADPSHPMPPVDPAFHFKQWGSWCPPAAATIVPRGDVHRFPDDDQMIYAGAGPKSGGKLLDGVEWCEFPTSAGALTPV